jgi:hypothetical protein
VPPCVAGRWLWVIGLVGGGRVAAVRGRSLVVGAWSCRPRPDLPPCTVNRPLWVTGGVRYGWITAVLIFVYPGSQELDQIADHG